MSIDTPNFESEPMEPREKPTLLYHGTGVPNIDMMEPRKRFTPGGQNAPERVYAGDMPAFAAAHSFPWATEEGFELSVEDGTVIFKVPSKFKSRLEQKVTFIRCLLIILSGPAAKERVTLTTPEKRSNRKRCTSLIRFRRPSSILGNLCQSQEDATR